MPFAKVSIALIILAGCLATGATQAAPADYFAIHIIDDQTGRGVPLVKLQTTNKVRYYTDSNGYVAFDEPGLMDQKIYFEISSWGYEAPEIGFDYHGAILHTTPGKEAEIKIHRKNIAERLYRLTGEGIYRDTVLLGKKPPIAQGLLNGKIMGSDTVETAIYHGKMYWFWGDSDCPFFPLGNFSTSGATSALPAELNLDRGIDYTYFVNKENGFARGMISVSSKQSLPIWIDGLMVVPDRAGHERLLCRFVRTKNLAVVEQGLAEFNDSKELFEQISTYPRGAPLAPQGHPMRAITGGKTYYYFPSPYPIARVLLDYEHATDLKSYEGFTCLKPGTAFANEHSQTNRDDKGNLVWAWQQGADPIGPGQFNTLEKAGLVKADESPYQMRDAATGALLHVVQGTVAWNPYLKKWTMLFGQQGGESNLGEIWFATANAPEGPWRAARKVATHAMKKDNNDFYNPMQHPEFMQTGGKMIYFEGTFVTTFSGNPAPTPRYDYNQMMYRLDLSDPNLALPEPPPGLTQTDPVPQ
jgi:hypothetical protein